MTFPLLTILILILVAILIFVLAVILIVVLSTVVLIIHNLIPRLKYLRKPAVLGYPLFYDLSFALKIRLTTSPKKIAAVIPPAVAFRPPVKIP